MAPSSKASAAHNLVHYDYTSLYESAFSERRYDIEFFVRHAQQEPGCPILEFGAGTGRITLPLARAGHAVTAVDASRPMLDRLQQHLREEDESVRARILCKRGDMRKLDLGRKFPLILATFNVVGHLSTFADMAAFLRCSARHMKKGGRLIFDVPIPHPDEVEADPEEKHAVPRFRHPDTKKWIYQTERFEYDPATQVLLVESELKVEGMRDPLTVPLSLRQWFPKEIEAILSYEGYKNVTSYADYSDNPGMTAKDTLVFVARRS